MLIPLMFSSHVIEGDVQTITIGDEAWNIKIKSTKDGRSGELERYVARVVQYMIYCIAGNQSANMLRKART